MDTRSIVIVALAGLVAFALPARADTTIKSDDASVEITVPNGWRQTKPLSPAIQIQVTNGRAAILVRVASKEDYKDLKAFAQSATSRFTERFTDADPPESKFEDVQVNGNQAIRVSAKGTQSNGVRRGYVMTFIDTDGMFVEVLGIANASAFQAEQQTMAEMAGRVKVLAAAGAGPTAQKPPATPPAGNIPPAGPPGRQPPTGRQPR
jgi:hypothetical protein